MAEWLKGWLYSVRSGLAPRISFIVRARLTVYIYHGYIYHGYIYNAEIYFCTE